MVLPSALLVMRMREVLLGVGDVRTQVRRRTAEGQAASVGGARSASRPRAAASNASVEPEARAST